MSVVARARAPKVAPDDVLGGLRGEPKRLPGRLLYEDAAGVELFEQLTGVDDYYPSRCELRVLDASMPAIAAELGVAARVIELGSGGIKTKRLLRALDQPASLVTIAAVRDGGALSLPPPRRPHGKTLVFVPGTPLDTFEPHDAVAFLGGLLRIAGPSARLLIGADATRDREALLRAYNDEDGVAAAFNKNVLSHLVRTRAATLDPTTFQHRAVWNVEHARVELHLVSQIGQEVSVGGEHFRFAAHEPLITEHAYKHSLQAMRGLLVAAGWTPTQVFTAQEQPMRLWLCEPRVRGV